MTETQAEATLAALAHRFDFNDMLRTLTPADMSLMFQTLKEDGFEIQGADFDMGTSEHPGTYTSSKQWVEAVTVKWTQDNTNATIPKIVNQRQSLERALSDRSWLVARRSMGGDKVEVVFRALTTDPLQWHV